MSSICRCGFDLDGFLDEPERVQVLELRASAELGLAASAYRHVGVATERAFLHVAVADLEVADERVNLAHVGAGFGRRAQIGRGHDLEQARAGAIQVDARHAREVLVQRLAGVFLEMRADDVDGARAAVFEHDVDSAAVHDRQLVLADLIALRQIRIEVVLAREHGAPRDLAARREAELDGHRDGFGVQHGQHARVAQVDEARLTVRRRAVGRRRAGEDLGLGRELRVDLEADDDFPIHCAHV